jgi:pimeloyl-ACP methyl ester carboxylesterase
VSQWHVLPVSHGGIPLDLHDVVVVNGTTLYYELTGTGPSVLFIAGTTGDAGHFAQVAARLADEFTVVTYDRRGNSRSPRPAGWSQTSVPEQAEDAAALIQALQLAPIAVFAASAGGPIGLDLMIRFPHLLRGVILHDPRLAAALAHPKQVMGPLQAAIQHGTQAKGPAGGVDAFLRYVMGDATVEAIPPQTLARMLQNAETALAIERRGAFATWHPTEEALAAIHVPVALLVGRESPAFFREMASWLAPRLQVSVVPVPGGHGAYVDHAPELAEALRPIFRQWSAR